MPSFFKLLHCVFLPLKPNKLLLMCVQSVKQKTLKGSRVFSTIFFCTLCLSFLGCKFPLVAGVPSSSSLIWTFSPLLSPFYHFIHSFPSDRGLSLVPLLSPFLQTLFPFIIALFLLPSFSHTFSLAIFFSLSPCSFSPCAIDLSPLPPLFLSSAITLSFSLGQGSLFYPCVFDHLPSFSPFWHWSFKFFFSLHGSLPSAITLCVPFYHCFLLFAIVLFLLQSFSFICHVYLSLG